MYQRRVKACSKCFSFGKIPGTKRYCTCKSGKARKKKESSLWFKTERLFWKTWYKAIDFPDEVKYFIQRGRRGWSDRDTWSLPDFLSKVICDSVLKLSGEVHGYPEWLGHAFNEVHCVALPEDDKRFEENKQKWSEILNKIAVGFAFAECIQEGGVWRGSLFTPYTKEQMEKYNHGFNEGMDLFKKHYFDLWD